MSAGGGGGTDDGLFEVPLDHVLLVLYWERHGAGADAGTNTVVELKVVIECEKGDGSERRSKLYECVALLSHRFTFTFVISMIVAFIFTCSHFHSLALTFTRRCRHKRKQKHQIIHLSIRGTTTSHR